MVGYSSTAVSILLVSSRYAAYLVSSSLISPRLCRCARDTAWSHWNRNEEDTVQHDRMLPADYEHV